VLTLLMMNARAQLFKEFFQQKKTQVEYLFKQIAALQIYIDAARDGYALVQEGLSMIGDFKQGEFDLHADRFASMRRIAPELEKSPVVRSIDLLHGRIVSLIGKLPGDVEKVGKQVQRLHDQQMRSFEDVVNGEQVMMTDSERLRALQNIQNELAAEYDFLRWLHEEIVVSTVSQRKEKVLR
jgi:hypothetical protein